MRGVGDAAPYRHNPLGFSLPQTATAARGLAALHPHLKICVGRGAPHPAEACRQIPFMVQSVGEGFIPPGHFPLP